MQSVVVWRGAAYRPRRATPAGPVACPACGGAGAFHSWRRRAVEYPDAEQPTYLLLQQAKYACPSPACARRYFTPPAEEAAPHARTARVLQAAAARQYRHGKLALREVAEDLRVTWHTRTGKSSVLRWHRRSLARDGPRPERLAFTHVLCIDEVHDTVGGERRPVFTCVDPIAGITVRIPLERADAAGLAAAMRRVRALGADPRVIVSDLWAAYPEALRQVWPRAQRQVCWFHVMPWTTRTLARLIRDYGWTLPEAERRELRRLRFRLLACHDHPERLDARERDQLARALDLVRGTVVAEALRLRDDLRAVLNTSASRAEARARFDDLRRAWPERFRPWDWRPGGALPDAPGPGAADGPDDLTAYLDRIRAFFLAHFEQLITHLDVPGVPRTSNHAERANRRYRAISRPRYGWGAAGQQAFLVALQGFDSS